MIKTIVGACVLAALLGTGLLSAIQTPTFTAWRQVVVQPGDTEWRLAVTYCPNADTRQVIAAICARNHLSGSDIQPGQILWVPSKAS